MKYLEHPLSVSVQRHVGVSTKITVDLKRFVLLFAFLAAQVACAQIWWPAFDYDGKADGSCSRTTVAGSQIETVRYTGETRTMAQWMDANPAQATKDRLALIYAWNEIGEGGWLVPCK